MSRRFDHSVEFGASSDKIYQDFTSRHYWEALMDVYRELIPQSEITRFECDDAGTAIVFTQHLPRANLAPIARAVMPADLILTREQRYEAYDHSRNRAEGTCGASISGVPGHFSGTYLLTGTDTGSQLQVAGVCKVRIPIIGGKLEDLILGNITQVFDSEGAFTADWIAKRH